MSEIVNGHVEPTLDVALAIWRHTGGAVSLRQLLDPHCRRDWPTDLRLFDADPSPPAAVVQARAAELAPLADARIRAEETAAERRAWKERRKNLLANRDSEVADLMRGCGLTLRGAQKCFDDALRHSTRPDLWVVDHWNDYEASQSALSRGGAGQPPLKKTG